MSYMYSSCYKTHVSKRFFLCGVSVTKFWPLTLRSTTEELEKSLWKKKELSIRNMEHTNISPMKKMKAVVETQKLSDDLEVPVFDMSPLLYSRDDREIEELSKKMGKAMAETSILIVRDPRVSKTDSGNFLDMMEEYFSQERELLDKDVRPALHYQVGATPEKTEKAICSTNHKCKKIVEALTEENKPHLKPDQGADPKWRYFWRIGERPKSSEFAELYVVMCVCVCIP